MNPFTGVILAGLFFVFVPIGIPTLIVCVVDILWSGPAALISAREAKKYGYDPSAYAKKGALYSLLNFTLWRSLMKLMHGERFDASDVKTGYIILFVCWFVTAPLLSILFAMWAFQSPPARFYLVPIWAVISITMWFTSIRKLREFHWKRISASVQELHDEPTETNGEISIRRGYLMPIMLAKLSILTTFIVIAFATME